MQQIDKIYLALSTNTITFPGAHTVHTPRALVEEILDQLPLSGNILVLFNVEFVASLIYTYGVDPINITFYSDSDRKTLFCDHMNVKSITSLESDMKFDVVVGNPPYSNNDTLLYPRFFEKSLALGKLVVMIMPSDLESQQVRLKSHNKLVKTHLQLISSNVTTSFNVGIPDIRYVIASLQTVNNVNNYVDPISSMPLLFPERKRLEPKRGIGDFSRLRNIDNANGVDVIISIYRGKNIQWRKIKSVVANKIKKSMISDAPYFVIVGENPSNGLFNTSIIKNDGVKWGSGVFAFEVNNYDEAVKLEEWLTSDLIQTEIKKMLTAKNTYTVSSPMVSRLPWYE